jgi:hypothetical protein
MFKLEWVILAEGIGRDSRGAFTLIGVNLNVFSPPSLPASTRRVVFAHFVDQEHVTGTIRFGIKVISPSGETVMANQAQVSLHSDVPWPNLPVTCDIPFEVAIVFNEYGAYRFEVSARGPKDETMSSHVYLNVEKVQSADSLSEPASTPTEASEGS